jgi:hypothetical protein
MTKRLTRDAEAAVAHQQLPVDPAACGRAQELHQVCGVPRRPRGVWRRTAWRVSPVIQPVSTRPGLSALAVTPRCANSLALSAALEHLARVLGAGRRRAAGPGAAIPGVS